MPRTCLSGLLPGRLPPVARPVPMKSIGLARSLVVPLSKSCRRCNQTLNLRHFRHHGSPRFVVTKLCSACRSAARRRNHSVQVKQRLEVLKRLISERREQGCAVKGCAERRPRALDFNHLRPELKVGNISERTWLWTPSFPEEFQRELEKCEVLCAVHHRLHTMEAARSSPPPSQRRRRRSPRFCLKTRQRSLADVRKYRNAALVKAFKVQQKGCEICARPICPSTTHAFDLDHVVPAFKRAKLGHLLKHGVQTVRQELEKTRLLCANCHRCVPPA
jgi:hypothetical protein